MSASRLYRTEDKWTLSYACARAGPSDSFTETDVVVRDFLFLVIQEIKIALMF